ncbi:MAG: hypothetical protein AAGC97_03860 [Planctomycetota bacterium]
MLTLRHQVKATASIFASTLWLVMAVVSMNPAAGDEPPRIGDFVRAANQAGPGGIGHVETIRAMNAWLNNGTEPIDHLMSTLVAMKDSNARGKNWLVMAASTIRGRIQDRDSLNESLQAFFDDRQHDPDARYFTYRQLVELNAADGEYLDRLLAGSVDDPSLPLRFLAIRKSLDDAETIENDDAAVVTQLEAILPLARHPDHLGEITKRLEELDVQVDLAEQLAMIRSWWTVAPFDNTGGGGFEVRYPVETDYVNNPLDPVSPDRVVSGADDPLAWIQSSTDDAAGMLDLNPIYDNGKDVVAYAFCLINLTAEDLSGVGSSQATAFEARLGCICANQVWVNGTQVMSNHVYHSGTSIDQYVAPCDLKPGLNSVLVKICQNAQTEPWAQDWQFQFRLTDSTGRGIPFEVVTPDS